MDCPRRPRPARRPAARCGRQVPGGASTLAAPRSCDGHNSGKDPRTHFTALQQKLGVHDALNEYIEHTGGGVFACPPGLAAAQFWGQLLHA
jgi:hypothetical protein